VTAPNSPAFTLPGTPGQLTNFHGGNVTDDSIIFGARQSNPDGTTNPLSLLRMYAERTAIGGLPSSPQLTWDLGWVGGVPAVNQLPAQKRACGGNSVVNYNERLYFMPSDGQLMSSPVGSPAVGTWRYENPLPIATPGISPTVYAMTEVAGRLYCTASNTSYISAAAGLYMAEINEDGTVGTWVLVPGGIVTQSDANWQNAGLTGFWDGNSSTGFLVIWKSPNCKTVQINVTDGAITAAISATVNPTFARDNLTAGIVVVNNSQGWILLIGGSASAASAVVDAEQVNIFTGVMSGVFAAKQALPAVRTGGTLIALQNNTIYYMGGSATNLASGAVSTVYYNSVSGILAPSAWTSSAQTLPTPSWLMGGGLTLPDYDLLAISNLADKITETITTAGALVSGASAMIVASFKAATTWALVQAGTILTGTNAAVAPTWPIPTVVGHQLFALVSGSDHTAGTPNLTLGETSAATSSFDFSGVNSDNEVFTDALFTIPAGGATVTKISCYFGGHTAAVNAKLCIWNRATGALIASSAQFSAGVGRALRSISMPSVVIAAGVTIRIGFWRDKAHDAEWGVAASGTFDYKTNVSAPGSVSGFGTCAGPYVCGHLQAYITYTSGTGAPSPITQSNPGTATGWSKIADLPNGDEELTIWMKPNSLVSDPAPAFASASGNSVMIAQLLEFSGGNTTLPTDQIGTVKQSGTSSSMIAAAPAPDSLPGELVISMSRWVLSAANTATLSDVQNNANNVQDGTTGASSQTRHMAVNHGIIPVGGTSTRSPFVCLVGGQTVAAAPTDVVIEASVNPASVPSDVRAWSSSIAPLGTALIVGNLSTGSGLNNNQDGTQDVTIPFGGIDGTLNGLATGTLFIGDINDGDELTITCQMVNIDGDPSPISTTTVKVGQPPTIGNPSPSGASNSCQPVVTFDYLSGVGGGAEASWEVQVLNNAAVIVADSGIVAGQDNFYAPKLYPLLASTLAASLNITVTSTDVPMPGSTNTSTIPVAFTPTNTAPDNSTTLSLTVDNVNGSVTAHWTNPNTGIPPITNRLWWRKNGSSVWLVAKQSIAALIATPQVFELMDSIPVGVKIDVGVSSLAGSEDTESAINLVGTGTISPDYHQDLGGWTAMLHILTEGPTFRVPIPNMPPVKYTRNVDSTATVMFGNTAPSVRYGVFNYRNIAIDVIPLNSQIVLLDTLMVEAMTGKIIVYRDTLGTVIYCALMPTQTRDIDLYYADKINLVETQFVFVGG